MARTPAHVASSRTKVPSPPRGIGTGPSIAELDYSFALALRAENRSTHTIDSYRDSLLAFVRFLEREGRPLAVDAITREQIEQFLVHLRDERGFAPSSLATRYTALRVFFSWCVQEDEISVSPMERMRQPKVGEKPREVITIEHLQALLSVCEGRDFQHRRDLALLRIFIDAGVRRGEMAGMQLADVDWQQARILVRGKGDRSRYIKLGKKALRALDSYRRVRANHPHADMPDLWLSRQGALSAQQIAHRIGQWATAAGLPRHIHPHLFRHTFAHLWLEVGGQEQDLMQLGGWRSPSVMYRYGAGLRAARALAAHERLSPGDRL